MANLNMTQKKDSGADPFAETGSRIVSGVITVGIVLLLTVFPLYLHDSYFDVLESKYQCYYMIALGTLGLSLLLGLILLFVDLKEYRCEHAKALFGKLLPKNWKGAFSLTDGAVFGFWLICAVSTFTSDYLYEAFWGNEGRLTGLFLLTIYVAMYFLISHFWKGKGYYVELFLVSGILMCLFGITDYFQMDIFNFREHVSIYEQTIYTSTVGNINTYTAYVGMLVGFSGMMFAQVESRRRMIWYYVCHVLFLFAIIMGSSDNAYLSMAVLYGLMPVMLIRNAKSARRYLVLVATFFTVSWCIARIDIAFEGTVIGIASLFSMIEFHRMLPVAAVLLWVIVIAFAAVVKRYPESYEKIGRKLSVIWAALIVMAVVGVAALLIYVNTGGNASGFGALGRYLVIDDRWGTNRGFVWKACLKFWNDLPFVKKLIGYGPETFGILAVQEYYQEMVSLTGYVFDNAHNEYLQYLVTIGVGGLFFYVGSLLTGCARMLKAREKSPYCAAAACAVLCYAAQATVNLCIPIATPVMWLLLSIGVALSKREGE